MCYFNAQSSPILTVPSSTTLHSVFLFVSGVRRELVKPWTHATLCVSFPGLCLRMRNINLYNLPGLSGLLPGRAFALFEMISKRVKREQTSISGSHITSCSHRWSRTNAASQPNIPPFHPSPWRPLLSPLVALIQLEPSFSILDVKLTLHLLQASSTTWCTATSRTSCWRSGSSTNGKVQLQSCTLYLTHPDTHTSSTPCTQQT